MMLKEFLNEKVRQYNRPAFIAADPISIPHRFTALQDIEISGFFAATFAWGARKIIIRKTSELMERMDNAPYDFIRGASEGELARLNGFVHRTFNATDLFYFVDFFRWHYGKSDSLEEAFARFLRPEDPHVGPALAGFHDYFFSLPESPQRTRKHVPTPERKSSCKRLNMYLRWMVRRDDCGVDFGLWGKIQPRQLLLPQDVHVGRVARRLGLLTRPQSDWQATLELTEKLREFDPEDPAKYDFALFGLGVEEKWV